MCGTCIPLLSEFKSYLNNCLAYCRTSTLFSYMRGSRIQRLHMFKNYLKNGFARLRKSLIFLDLASSGYLGLKII